MLVVRRLLLAAGLYVLLCGGALAAKSAAEVFEAVAPSVVTVHAHDAAGKEKSQGSGVVIGREEVATNCHVVEGAVRFSVGHRGRRHAATVKHADGERDVCSLSVPGLAAPAAPLSDTSKLKVGQKVYAVGAPQGLELTLSEGIVSALREVGKGGRVLQTTAPISPGSSGGGLFDEQGRLIGLPTFYLSEGQQLNFAVPVEWVRELPQRGARAAASPRGGEWLAKAIALQDRKDWLALIAHGRAWTRAQPGNADA